MDFCIREPPHPPGGAAAIAPLQSDDSSRSSEGTGLGLALVKSIVDLHGGTVAVANEVGRGTQVTLKFPNKPTGGSEHP